MNDKYTLLNEFSPNWSLVASSEMGIITDSIPCNIIEKIEHIGSTSVKGCLSQPIIDIAIQVAKLENGKLATFPLEAMGYKYWKENPDKNFMFFAKHTSESEDVIAHHLYFFEATKFNEFLNFRNLLRRNAKVLEDYQSLKVRMAEECKVDSEAYTTSKIEFINKALTL